MKLGDGVEVGIHCAAALAALPANAVISASSLAQAFGVSSSYLLKHLKQLTALGILKAVPGPKGGYRLGRPADEISLLDLVMAIEGNKPAFRCQEIRQNLPNGPDADAFVRPCGINKAMLKAEQAWRQVLRETSLKSLIDEHHTTSDPRVLAAGCAFANAHMRIQPSK